MANYKELVQEIVDQVWNPARGPSAMDRYYAPDYRNNDPSNPQITDRDGLRAFATAFAEGFPDYSLEVLDLIGEGSKVVKRFLFGGTHTGTFNGSPPTGRHVEVIAACVYRFEGDKVAECWWHHNMLGLMEQLGFELAPAAVAPA